MTIDFGSLPQDLERTLLAGPSARLAGFSVRLAEAKWNELHRTIGLRREDYGTGRVRAGDAEGIRCIQAELILPTEFNREGSILVEALDDDTATRYVDLGLEFAPAPIAGSSEVVHQIREALRAIACVAGIAAAIGPVLHVVHVALPEGPDYDVSYSDPTVPFSVFVGIAPAGNGSPAARLRLAEGILHEAMHLQLTLVEGVVPLIADETQQHHSPWQDTMRPARGILHGIYVFAVIREFMESMATHSACTTEERRHAAERVAVASAEIREAAGPLLGGCGLTPAGRRLVESLGGEGPRDSSVSSQPRT